jgi:hypothetical protein
MPHGEDDDAWPSREQRVETLGEAIETVNMWIGDSEWHAANKNINA